MFFVLQFVFSITHWARAHITRMTSGEHVVDVSVWGHIQTRQDPDIHDIKITQLNWYETRSQVCCSQI